HVEMPQHPQYFEQGDRAGTWRPHAADAVPAVRATNRRPLACAIGGEICQAEIAGILPCAVDGGDDVLRDRPAIERIGAAGRDGAEGRGEGRVHETRSRRAGGIVEIAARRLVQSQIGIARKQRGKPRRGGEALLREGDGRREERAPGKLSIAAMRQFEHAQQTGHADRAAADDRGIEGEGDAIGAEKSVGAFRRGRSLSAVERDDTTLGRRPIDEERAAADAGGLRLDEVEHELRGDCSVDGVAAATQDVAPRRGGERIGRSHHLMPGEACLLRRPDGGGFRQRRLRQGRRRDQEECDDEGGSAPHGTIVPSLAAGCKRARASSPRAALGARNRRDIVTAPSLGDNRPMSIEPGPRNLITDVDGILIGNAADERVRSGVSVVIAETPAVAAVDVRGGAPGTRETDALDPTCLVDTVDAVVLSGGSAFGLEAASAAMTWLAARGRGFPVGSARVPIVPAAILFDLLNGGDKEWGERPPYAALARAACAAASRDVALGNTGAGFGAKAGSLKGGLGSVSAVTPEGLAIGALVAVNSRGETVMPGERCFWAWPFERRGELGGQTPPRTGLAAEADILPGAGPDVGANTTIGVVATNAILTRAEAQRIAIMAQDGYARAIRPVHTPFDGDTVFVLATGRQHLPEPRALALARLGVIAADCVARAVARGVFSAASLGDLIGYSDWLARA